MIKFSFSYPSSNSFTHFLLNTIVIYFKYNFNAIEFSALK